MATIHGKNYSEEGCVHYESLDETPIAREEDKSVLREIDKRFKMLGSADVEPLRIEGDVADLSAGYYIHGIPVLSTTEEIASRREYGLTCTEYFGKPESAKECSYCLAVTKTNNPEKDSFVDKRYILDENGNKRSFDVFCMSVIPEVGFIIDNSVTHRTDNARQLNFFEYKRDKEAFIKKYNATEEEIKILETIDKNSPKAEMVITGPARESYEKFNWVAITGGVPSQFVVGVIVNSKLIDAKAKSPWLTGGLSRDEYYGKTLETARICGEIFNVPVLDECGNIIYHAKENFLGA